MAIDPLQKLFNKAIDMGLLTKLGAKNAQFRTSLYADNAAIFIRPTHADVTNTELILRLFGEASGLCTNLQKTQLIPISCDRIDLEVILADLPLKRTSFPIRYLGLPLSTKRLGRLDF